MKLESTLVLCDLDALMLGPDGNLTQVLRDVLQLFTARGGRMTVFSQKDAQGGADHPGQRAPVRAGPAVRRGAGLQLCGRQRPAHGQLCGAGGRFSGQAAGGPPASASPCR